MKRLILAGETYVVDFDAMCPCGNHATHLLEMHAIDYCTPEEPTRTQFICNACLAKVYAMTAKLLTSGNDFCSSCLLTLGSQCVIIVSLVPIPPKVGRDA